MKNIKTKKIFLIPIVIGVLAITAAVLVWIGNKTGASRPATVAIAGEAYPADIVSFTVTDPDFDYSQLAPFHSLQSVDVTAVEVDAEQYRRISSRLGGQIEVLWRIPFNGDRLPSNTTELHITSEPAETDIPLLSYFTNLTDVTVTDIHSLEKLYPIMKAIRETNPDVNFQCSTSLYGVPLDYKTETLILNEIPITNTDTLCQAIEVFPHLKTVEMCDCGLSNDVMGQLRETYPTVNFVWMIHVLNHYVRTDAQVFSTLAESIDRSGDSATFSPLFRYCTELRALDLGHMKITDISEIRNLKKLHTLILADNFITDISPLADLKELNYIEIFQNNITDISPLLELPHLQDLNICYNPHLENITSITQCKTLQRLYCSNCGLSEKDITAIQKGIPDDCEFNWTAGDCVRNGWRWHIINGEMHYNPKNTSIRKAFANWQNVKAFPSWDNIIYK